MSLENNDNRPQLSIKERLIKFISEPSLVRPMSLIIIGLYLGNVKTGIQKLDLTLNFLGAGMFLSGALDPVTSQIIREANTPKKQ